jgi:SAM-dependent methyltransferase
MAERRKILTSFVVALFLQDFTHGLSEDRTSSITAATVSSGKVRRRLVRTSSGGGGGVNVPPLDVKDDPATRSSFEISTLGAVSESRPKELALDAGRMERSQIPSNISNVSLVDEDGDGGILAKSSDKSQPLAGVGDQQKKSQPSQNKTEDKTLLFSQGKALSTLDKIYENHSAEAFWFMKHGLDDHETAKKEAGRLGFANAGIYGEILPLGFANFLRQNAKRGQKFYDLGAGHGKTVALAYLMGLDATGIEIVSSRWQNACTALKRFKMKEDMEHGVGMRFMRGNFLDIDFSDADIILIDNMGYADELNNRTAAAAHNLKPGAKILSAKKLHGPEFTYIGEFPAPSSWSEGSIWNLQEVARSNVTAHPAHPSRKAREEARKEAIRQADMHNYGSHSPEGPNVCAF